MASRKEMEERRGWMGERAWKVLDGLNLML